MLVLYEFHPNHGAYPTYGLSLCLERAPRDMMAYHLAMLGNDGLLFSKVITSFTLALLDSPFVE